MRNVLLQGAGILGALAITLGAAACSQGTEQANLASNGNESVKSEKAGVQTASLNAAEQRAAEAEARAAAAEAKIQCERDRQAASNRGAIVGGVTGAVVGSQVAGDGAKSEGGAIGAVGGVLAGRQIAKKDHRC